MKTRQSTQLNRSTTEPRLNKEARRAKPNKRTTTGITQANKHSHRQKRKERNKTKKKTQTRETEGIELIFESSVSRRFRLEIKQSKQNSEREEEKGVIKK